MAFHALFDDDDAVYAEDAMGGPSYDWSSIDAIYDAIVAAGMRPRVEISFTPKALASDPTQTLSLLWYHDKSPNISPPTGTDGDWGKWTALMTAFVRHLEVRYGATEVRAWYFEVWNDPSWMYSLGDNAYFELYQNTVAGLVAADPEMQVGGPAGSSGESTGLIKMLIAGSINTGTKLDFLTYHRYGDDDGVPIADVADAVTFHESLMSAINTTVVKGTTFTGLVMNDEFGPSYKPDVSLSNLSFTGPIRIRQYIVDYSHANSYRAWLAMGSPSNPTQAQWVTLRDSAELCHYDTTLQPVAGAATFQFAQGIYGVDLLQSSSAAATTSDAGSTSDSGAAGSPGPRG
jgi:xylan 1,4-beta-xylosidase